ncbi:protein FLC EXPRESSOR-like, partial [Carica papaya]|uniref:protein FLC EXPRESSOR-like n=1 Tax=Carica papaya TaxID=3649 RepID=UPI000B8CA127
MAGRNRLPPGQPAAAYAFKRREVPLTRGIHRPAPNPVVLEEHIAIQHREIQSLIIDNQRLEETHMVLKQELAAARQELRHLSVAAAEVKAETDAQVREVYEKSLKMDAEARAIDAMNAELAKVLADVKNLAANRQELVAELQEINANLAEAKSDSQKVAAVKDEIETL